MDKKLIYNQDLRFPKMLSCVIMCLTLLLFIPSITMKRMVQIGPMQVSLAILFFPLVYSIADSITEVYKKNISIFVLSSCYLVSLVFSLLLMGSVSLPFPDGFNNKDVYYTVFHQGPWVVIVGFLSVGLSMYVNINLISKWQMKLRGRHFILRSIVASSVGELIVTGIGYPLIWMKLDQSLLMIMMNAYLIKVLYSIVAAIPARIIVFLLRVVDGKKDENYNVELADAHRIDVEIA